MDISPEEFIKAIKSGKNEKEINKNERRVFTSKEIKSLIDHGHTVESAKEHLSTDYSNGYTICKQCGSFYHLGKGFTKHLSDGCLNCEGKEKHRCYWVERSPVRFGGFPARWMCVMFDDGLHYCKEKLEINKFDL